MAYYLWHISYGILVMADNKIADDGAKELSEALKINNAIKDLELHSKHISCGTLVMAY